MRCVTEKWKGKEGGGSDRVEELFGSGGIGGWECRIDIYCPPKLKPPVGAATVRQLVSMDRRESIPSDWKAY